MRLRIQEILILTALAATSAQRCPGLRFHEKIYNIETLKEGVPSVHQIIYNRNDNTLYFIFDQIALVPTRVLGYLNLNSKESGVIDGIRNASALAIDPDHNNIYVGSEEGIFRLNGNRRPYRLPLSDKIISLFFKNDILYYVTDRKEAFIYENGFISPCFELQGTAVENIVLDDDNNIFFTQTKTLYRVKVGTKAVNTHERFKVDVLAVDTFYRPYIATQDGIYVYNKYKYVFDGVSDLKNVRALTFNKSLEPIFVILDSIIKLNFNSSSCNVNSYR